ncbi:MAG TPA: type I-E CRISPR-associated protein Cas6/Cse3/CasE [Dehalococcoidia bacterium]|nr:type I-E CRISPR-associated protein Cas6/Cse3/CasE [Dehalococcoidia bacterium]
MYLSQLVLNARDYWVRRDLANCQELHRTLLAAFPAEGGSRAEVGLLFRVEGDGAAPVVLAQSLLRPDWERLRGRSPGYLRGGPGEGWQVKEVGSAYAALREGAVLRFRLRANPTRKIETKSGPDGERHNGRRVALLKEEQRLDWLARKADAAGFALRRVQSSDGAVPAVDVRPEDNQRGWREAGSGKRQLLFGSVLFEGELCVSDAERFRAALTSGIGSGKAYGFGLLSIAPA